MIVIQIAGRLGKDPETRFTASGQKVTTLTVATNTRKAGKDETVWWRVTIWGDRFDKMLTYLKKGSAVIVIGDMGKPEIWIDKEGKPQVSLDITAEAIRFSPFGSPDKQQDHSGHSSGQGQFSAQTQQPQTGYANQEARTEYGTSSGFKGGYADTASSTAPAGQHAGTAYHSESHDNEDSLPF
jgi:single-strand DNA-binding protein